MAFWESPLWPHLTSHTGQSRLMACGPGVSSSGHSEQESELNRRSVAQNRRHRKSLYSKDGSGGHTGIQQLDGFRAFRLKRRKKKMMNEVEGVNTFRARKMLLRYF